ncbi:myrosinase 1-like [Pectinophora gossypiella]|uniref:myrosinase 1-like n=1 Tax=Pectinophora gossypiella TaxID=13191 RepID=UPI00214ED98D|nr:myrosinase 1-like [Pectinophora gossypiella]
MEVKKILILFSLSFISAISNEIDENLKSFPADFEFGTSTASYQIEGAWNEGGKGWSMWDYVARARPEAIRDGSNADIACNSYHLYKRDIEMLKELGVDNYRLSIAWPRILPYGRPDYVNPEGIAYYNAVIDELLANGITPFVTMYHWDLPQNLNEQGGWITDEIVDWFGDYARVLYQHFGDRVKNWLTLNEPYVHCFFGYGRGSHAPLRTSPGVEFYECGRNILLANARAYHIYDEEFRAAQGGKVGLVISMEWVLPLTDSDDDVQGALDYAAYHIDHYMHPIFSEEGNFPQIVIDRVAEASANQGLNASRLRPFAQEQIDYMKGTADFLGLNHYSSKYVYRNSSVEGRYDVPSVEDDIHVVTYQPPSWPSHGFIYEYAPGLYNLLMYLKDQYNNPVVYITENGFSSDTGLVDDGRVQYMRNYMRSVVDAVADGANVKGYFAWSLMDNFEWSFGYTLRFGMYQVDMDDPDRTRTPRKSALVYKEILRSRVIDYSYDPDPYAALPDAAVAYYAPVMLNLIVLLFNLLM